MARESNTNNVTTDLRLCDASTDLKPYTELQFNSIQFKLLHSLSFLFFLFFLSDFSFHFPQTCMVDV
jgi:hypothetical protein